MYKTKTIIILLLSLLVYSCSSDNNKTGNSNNDTLGFCIKDWSINEIGKFQPLLQNNDQQKRNEIAKITGNSYEKDSLFEQYYLSQIDTSVALRIGDSLRLKIKGGQYLYLVNKSNGDDDIEFYTLNCILINEGFYLLNDQWYEGGDNMLINIKTGTMTRIIGNPYFSPDYKYVITVSEEEACGADYSSSGIQIFINNNGNLKLIKECSDWYVDYVNWTSNNTFNIARTLTDDQCNKTKKYYKIKIK